MKWQKEGTDGKDISDQRQQSLASSQSVEVPEKEKLKINLSYLSWKTESMGMPPVKRVSGKFGLGFAIEQIERRQIFSDLGQL